MNKPAGYRGYISSRPVFDNRTPQHVQNLVLREYARRNDFQYLLSATEYAMPGCYQMLEGTLSDISSIDGILCYSLFMLPRNRDKRLSIFRRILEAGKSIHFAVEDLSITREEDVPKIEDFWLVQNFMAMGA